MHPNAAIRSSLLLLCAAAIGVILILSPGAHATADATPPVIPGTATIGSTLTATSPGTTSPPQSSRSYTWLRCDGATGSTCAPINGAGGTSYGVTSADSGYRLRLELTSTWNRKSVTTVSNATDVVRPAAPPPGPVDPVITPVATPGPVITPVPTPGPVITPVPTVTPGTGTGGGSTPGTGTGTGSTPGTGTGGGSTPGTGSGSGAVGGPDQSGSGTTVTQTGAETGSFSSGLVTVSGEPPASPGSPPPATTPRPATPTRPRTPSVMRPFPVIRIAGRFTARGTRLTLVTVRAPRGSTVSVTCANRRCRAMRVRVGSALVRLRGLERTFAPRTVVDIRVTRRGVIGKRTRVRIMSGAAPVRTDGCLSTAGRSMRCPS